MALRFGIHTGQQNTTFSDLLALWQRAEAIGLDWASVFDHFIPIFTDPHGPCFEGFSVLSALAAGTKKLRCGIIVSGVTYRNPVLLAKAATTVDHVSNGRMELGLGAAWFELEHEQYNFSFPSVATRMDMLEEACQIVTSLFRQERTTFEGRHFSVKDALFLPKPVHGHIPLWIGGGGEKRTLRAVARYADGWNYFLTTPADFQRKLGFLEEHCQEAGRKSSDIRKALIVRAILDQPQSPPDDQTFVGSAAGLAEKLRPFVDLGVQDFLLLARPPADQRTLENWACEVRSLLS
ncbi:MAG: LLM class F420-dependent oxidoreductase [Vulcanimicrobiota bacterium]